jgi:hypothetical protein
MMQGNVVQVDDARLSVPDGGIASFVSDDDEIDDVEDFGSEGIAQFPALAQRMAAMGRGGDDTLAHVQTGELIIPAALLAQDPALKEGLFQRLRDMGIEDPERYVVGSEINSLNPETGIPEFFLKKVFKGISKAVSNVVKGVVKVVKKIAPVVLPIVGSMVFGPIYGAALGSGIATLINGGSFKDALKSAAISGITGGIGAGVSGAISGAGFGAGVKAALNPGNISAGFGALKTGFTEGFGQSGIGFNSMKYGIAGGEQISGQLAERAALAAGTQAPQLDASMSTSSVTDAAVADAAVAGTTPTPATTSVPGAASGTAVTPGQIRAEAIGPGTFGENLKDAFTPGGKSFGKAMGDAFFPSAPTLDTTAIGNQAYTNAYTNAMQLPGMTPTVASQIGQTAMTDAVKSATAAAAPGFLRTYGPLALAGTAVAAGTGMFTPVPGEEPGLVEYGEDGRPITGTDLVRADPTKYLVGDLGSMVLNPETGQYESRTSTSVSDLYPTYQMPTDYSVPTTFAANTQAPFLMGSTPGGPFARPSVVRAAEGGAIFPRRNGGIMPDEGIPGEDSVRAMLMPGEFVMTTDAVRGFGNGDLNNGIKNMYSVMRNLESRGRAMA